MPLLEALVTGIGAAVAKGVLKMWLKDDSLVLAATTTTADILKSKFTDVLQGNAAAREFEKIRDRSAASFRQMLEKEEIQLSENDTIFIANAAAEVISNTKLTAQLLAEQNLDPNTLAEFFLTRSGAEGGNPGLAQSADTSKRILYAHILLHASQQIVDVSSQFPQFHERVFSSLLEGQDQIYQLAARVLDGMDRLVAAQCGVDPDTERFETNYRLACVRRLDQLLLFGVDLQESNKRYKLSVAYVTLEMERTCIEEEDLSEGDDDEEDLRTPLAVDQAIHQSKRLLVRGPAGSGKTTLLQWVAVFCAGREHEGDLAELNDLVPFVIKLRDFDDQDLPSADRFAKLISTGLAGEPDRWAHKVLESGRGIILVDGLDEASEKRREDIRLWLQDLLTQYPTARCIVTTRPHAVKEGWLDDDSFVDATLQEMNRNDVANFITHWHDAVAAGLQDEHDKQRLPELASALIAKMRQSGNLTRLATSPLLCAMICALHRDRQQHLPDDRIELYRACIEMFFRRDEERQVAMSDYVKLTDSQKLLLLQSFAWWLIRNGKSSATPTEAYARFDHGLAELNNRPKEAKGETVARLFIDRVAILRQFAAEKIDFPHRTFQEYLAAQEAIAENDQQLLIDNAEKEQWREVAVLAAGLIGGKAAAEEFVLALLNRGDKSKAHQQTLYLIGAAAFESVTRLPDGSTAQAEVSKRLQKIIPPKSIKAATELAAAGNLVVPLLKYDSRHRAPEVAASIRTLAVVDTVESVTALMDYALDSRMTVHKQFKTSVQFVAEDAQLELTRRWKQAKIASIDLSRSNLVDCHDLSDRPSLETLSLNSCSQLTDVRGLGSCQSLQALYLYGCRNVTNESIKKLKNQLPSLNIKR